MDKRVEIHGTTRADINGKRGVATDFHMMDFDDRSKDRYTVQLDSGEAFKLKPANVRAEATGGVSGRCSPANTRATRLSYFCCSSGGT